MDDPLVGLTFWQRDNRPNGPGRPLRVQDFLFTNQQESGEDSNKVEEEREKAKGRERQQQQRTPGEYSGGSIKRAGSKKASKRGQVGGDLDNCFPCLPAIEAETEREKELGESSELDSHGSGRTTPDSGAMLMDSYLLNSPVPQPQNFWLMRLFQSKLFDMSIAIGYLFNSKEADVQAYLGNKLFVSIYMYLRRDQTVCCYAGLKLITTCLHWITGVKGWITLLCYR